MDRHFKNKILDFRLKWGRQEAEERLLSEGLSKSITQKLLAGVYPHMPKGLHLAAINRALGKK